MSRSACNEPPVYRLYLHQTARRRPSVILLSVTFLLQLGANSNWHELRVRLTGATVFRWRNQYGKTGPERPLLLRERQEI